MPDSVLKHEPFLTRSSYLRKVEIEFRPAMLQRWKLLANTLHPAEINVRDPHPLLLAAIHEDVRGAARVVDWGRDATGRRRVAVGCQRGMKRGPAGYKFL